jgi:transcriptional regulator with XRE-family HTH domain
MLLGKRLKDLREAKKLTQGDVEKATGLTRPYISRVENGRSVPGIEILERWARAFGMPLYQVMYDGEEPPPLKLLSRKGEKLWGESGPDAEELKQLCDCLSKMSERHRTLLLSLVSRMAPRSHSKQLRERTAGNAGA